MKRSGYIIIYRWAREIGLDVRQTLMFFREFVGYIRAYRRFAKQLDSDWPIAPSYPCLSDKYAAAGTAQGHYFHQDLLVSQLIFKRSPRSHVDVGSRVDGFVAHVAAFRKIEVLDIRPLSASIGNITFRQADLMSMRSITSGYCDSLSCLHALEHFGLGRYGDPLNARGWQEGLLALATLLETGGLLYLSVPVGAQRVEFNGHRVFAPNTVVTEAKLLGLKLEAFHYIDDKGLLHENKAGTVEMLNKASNLHYGCGIFEFRKPSQSSGIL